MKRLISTFSFMLIFGLISIFAQDKIEAKTAEQSQIAVPVKAYYFHATRRCATCEAVEAVTKEALQEYYGDKVTFESINREENKDNPLVSKYEISGQTLLIIKGDEKIDLTNEAFLNARTNPEKFKTKLKSTIDAMM